MARSYSYLLSVKVNAKTALEKMEEVQLELLKMIYTNLRLVENHGWSGVKISNNGPPTICTNVNEHGYMGRFEYKNKEEAIAALEAWDNQQFPPGNWVRFSGFINFTNPKSS